MPGRVVRLGSGPLDQPPRTGPARAAGRTGRCGPGRCWSWPSRPGRKCGPAGSGSRRRPASVWSARCPVSGPALHLDTAITLPIGVEAYAAYALRAWLARDPAISARTRRFARWSAICSLALGMAGQVAYHLMAQAGMTRAPWAITTVVSCLPVLVLGMGTALAHMLRADAETTDAPDNGTRPPAALRSLPWSPRDRDRPDRARPETDRDRSPSRDQNGETPGRQRGRGGAGPGFRAARPPVDQARVVARRLAAAGKPVSRRALR